MQLSSILTWALFLTPLIGWWCLIGTTVEQQSSGKEKIIGSRKGKKNPPSCLSCFRCNRLSTTVQFDQSSSQALCSDLGELQIKPDKLDPNSIRRESVIFRTPSQSPQDSLSDSPPSVISHSSSENSVFFDLPAMEEAVASVKLKLKKVENKMRKLPLANFGPPELILFDSHMTALDDAMEDFLASVDGFCVRYEADLGEENVLEWENKKTTLEIAVVAYQTGMRKKAFELKASNPAPAQQEDDVENLNVQMQTLALRKKEVEIQEKTLAAKEKELVDARNRAIAKAKIKCDAIVADCKNLNKKIDIEFLADFSNIDISRMMKEKDKWKDELEKIVELKRNLEDIAASNNLTEEESKILEAATLVQKLVEDVDETIEAVIEEDSARELYSLDTTVNEKVKLPSFEGRDDEDFSKWKELVERAFVKNRVAKDDKLLKLREILKGHAKKLVPYSMTNTIDDAWKALESAYGDPSKLMQNRKDALSKLGQLPKDNAKGGLKAKVEWYLELEVIIKSIKDFGSKSEDMFAEAFSANISSDFLKIFYS